MTDSLVTGSNNEEVYAVAARDLVLDSLAGFDAVIFAYGQTASGKSFTISGNAKNPGIIPQAVQEIFLYIKAVRFLSSSFVRRLADEYVDSTPNESFCFAHRTLKSTTKRSRICCRRNRDNFEFVKTN